MINVFSVERKWS